MTKLNKAIEHWLFQEYRVPAAGFGLFRILFALVLLLVRFPDGLWIASMPPSLLDPPPGFTYFATEIPPGWFFQALNGVGVLSGVALLFGWHTGLFSFLVSAVLLTLNAWSYSFGKINHDLLFVLLPPFMALAGWGANYSLDARKSTRRQTGSLRAWPLALFALTISLAMFSAARPKLSWGWLNTSTQAVKWHVLFSVEVRDRANPMALTSLERVPDAAWEVADITTVVIEAAFLICVIRRRAFQIVCALACFFHLGVAVLMEITFVANLLAYSGFSDWWKIERLFLVQALSRSLSRRTRPFSPVHVLSIGGVLAAGYVAWGNPVHRLLRPLTLDPVKAIEIAVTVAGAGVAIYFLASLLFSKRSAEVGSKSVRPRTGALRS